MAKKIIKLIVVILLIAAISFFAKQFFRPSKVEIVTQAGSIVVDVETAKTKQETRVGLMHRDQLGQNSGMIFIFPDEQLRNFWMKNTLIPLDIIFISKKKIIVSIQENATPCQSDPCPLYNSGLPSMYVLEVNAGFCQANGISEGDELMF